MGSALQRRRRRNPLASADGLIDPDRSRRRRRCRHRPAWTPPCRSAGRCRARYPAGPGCPVAGRCRRRPGGEHDRPSQFQPFAAGAAVGSRVDLVAVQALRQGQGGAVTGALVLGDPAGAGHPSGAGCVHRLRHAAVVAVAAASGDGLECLHHRSRLHGVAAAGLRAGLVRSGAAVGGQGAWCCAAAQQCVPGLGADRQGPGRPCRAAEPGRDGPGRRAAVLGADAVQYPAVAGGGDDPQWLRGG
ncbi:hypothetical protein D3C81_776020 [compost metagenome]